MKTYAKNNNIVLLFILFSCTQHDPQLIMPGKSVGEIILGETVLSELHENEKQGRQILATEGLFISSDAENNGIIQSVKVTSNSFYTTEGIKIGSSKDEVLFMYGNPISALSISISGLDPQPIDNSMKYEGIGFFLNEVDEVVMITIFIKDIRQ